MSFLWRFERSVTTMTQVTGLLSGSAGPPIRRIVSSSCAAVQCLPKIFFSASTSGLVFPVDEACKRIPSFSQVEYTIFRRKCAPSDLPYRSRPNSAISRLVLHGCRGNPDMRLRFAAVFGLALLVAILTVIGPAEAQQQQFENVLGAHCPELNCCMAIGYPWRTLLLSFRIRFDCGTIPKLSDAARPGAIRSMASSDSRTGTHSISSSARSNNSCFNVKPKLRAALRLMTNSKRAA